MSEAVAAIQTGDIPALERLLDADPELLHRRLTGYGGHGDYFRDPKLLWFVADNPNLIEVMPANSVEVTRALLARGPEQADLDYTLELVMTSGPAREQGLQLPLMDVLIEPGRWQARARSRSRSRTASWPRSRSCCASATR